MNPETQKNNLIKNPPVKSAAADERWFCSRPFEWFEIQGREGHFCCSGWSTIEGINMHNKTVADIWNGPEAQEFRASILDGSFRHCNPECCPYINQVNVPIWEKKGCPVTRIEDVTDPRLKKIIAGKKTVMDHGPLVFNCAYDRSCNLSCPSCRSQVVALKGDEIKETMGFQDRIFKEIGHGLEVLYVSGNGDPFASAVYRNLLRGVSSDEFPGMDIHLGTNAVLWTRENWEAMGRINKNIKTAHISVDAATPETYAVNRRGGDWNKLMNNLQFVSELRRSGALRYVTLSFVVQRNNYREMPAFVKLVESFGFDMAYFQKFQDWGSLNEWELDLRAIQSPEHPEYPEFLKVLTDPILGQSNVGLFCMIQMRTKALEIKARPGGFFRLGLVIRIRRFFQWPVRFFGMVKRKLLTRAGKIILPKTV